MRTVKYDPGPNSALDGLWLRNEHLADAIEDAIDTWVREGDERAKRRAFAGGIFAFEIRGFGEDWTVLWEVSDADGIAYIRFIGETASI